MFQANSTKDRDRWVKSLNARNQPRLESFIVDERNLSFVKKLVEAIESRGMDEENLEVVPVAYVVPVA